MKIVAINGSGTGAAGSTGQTLTGVVEGARAAGAEVETFLLTNLTISPCKGCHTCQKTGQCIINDDYQKVSEAMLKADGLVIASPNYISNVSASIKALLDRSFSILFHCQAMRGKYGAVVVASAGPVYQQVEDYLLHVTGTMGCWNVGSLVVASAQMGITDEHEKTLEDAKDLGRRLVEAIKTKQCFPEQEEQRELAFETMRWLVETQKDTSPHEYEYWQQRWGFGE
jgi:multimeric flavodoxin WrbA